MKVTTMWRRLRRLSVLALVLATVGVTVPDSAPPRFDASLVRVDSASGLDADTGVVWILALGSDARPGEPVLLSRADSIHLVGINTRTGNATIIGIPRDSYVDIPGYGRDKINAAMTYGGPQLQAEAVAGMVGITPDYVFTTSFEGFSRMTAGLGGVNVYSPDSFSLPEVSFQRGRNQVSGRVALAFVRERKSLPGGDFDRSRNQGQFLIDGLRKVAQVTADGGIERVLWSFAKHTDIDTGPVELYRLARAVLEIAPAKIDNCVITGSFGFVGAASVVFPNLAQAQSLAADAGRDATLEGGCS